MRTLPGPRMLWVIGVSLLSAVALRLSFPVPGLWPLAWVALAPWLVVVREGRGRDALVGSAVTGLVSSGLGLSWQYIVTPGGGAGLSLYVGSYFLLFAWLARVAMRLRVPFVLAAPVLWVGGEYLRSFFLTGFPWLFVGHTQLPFLWLVQMSDLFGAYSVSFVVVAANALVSDAILAWWRGRRHRQDACATPAQDAGAPPARGAGGTGFQPVGGWRPLIPGAAFVAALVAGAAGYGAWRIGHVASREGPLVGIVQGNVPQTIKNEQTLNSIDKILGEHYQLTREVLRRAAGQRLDLVVWPETMVQLPLNRREYPAIRDRQDALKGLARLLGCPLLVGAHAEIGADRTIEAEADGTVRTITDGEITTEDRAYLLPHYADPETGQEPVRRVLVKEGQQVRKGDPLAEYESLVFNSAYLIRPDAPLVHADRYDKTHLVPFGEYMPLHGLLWFLRQVVPYGKGFSAGDQLHLLRLNGVHFGVLICFESAFPNISRRYVVRPDGPGADFLINISNDGWFQGSHELDQHLAICSFRAIELRTGIVRSVNSGISAIIEPTGRVREVVRDSAGRTKLVAGVAVGRVPLRAETTFYARHGDLFASLCLILAGVVAVAAVGRPFAARFRRPACAEGACRVR